MATIWTGADAAAAEPPKHQWPLMHYAGRLFGYAMVIIPRRPRMNIAVLLARLLLPLFRRTAMCRHHVGIGIDTPNEVALYCVLTFMTAAGCRFDLDVRHEREDVLSRALASGRGVLIAMPHGLLNYALFRHLWDRGADHLVVAVAQQLLLGTSEMPRGIDVGPMMMRKALRAWERGETVCAMLDKAEASRRSIPVRTSTGILHIADPLFRLASSADARIIFCSARLEAGSIMLAWHEPGAEPLTDFAAFIREEAPSSRHHLKPRHAGQAECMAAERSRLWERRCHAGPRPNRL